MSSNLPLVRRSRAYNCIYMCMYEHMLLGVNFKVTGYRNGHGQRFRWTNSHALGYSCKTRRMSQEEQHKLAQRQAMNNLKGAVVHEWSKLTNFPAKFHFRKQPGGKNECKIHSIFEGMRRLFCRIYTSRFLRNSLFSTKTPRITQLLLMTADTIQKSSLSYPAYSIL